MSEPVEPDQRAVGRNVSKKPERSVASPAAMKAVVAKSETVSGVLKPIGSRYRVRVLIAIMTADTGMEQPDRHDKTCRRVRLLACFDHRRVMNSADVADAMERTRKSMTRRAS